MAGIGALRVAQTLKIGELEVHVDEEQFLLGHDRDDDGYDVFAQGSEVIPALEALLEFARKHQPAPKKPPAPASRQEER